MRTQNALTDDQLEAALAEPLAPLGREPAPDDVGHGAAEPDLADEEPASE
jgi:hypothetical protein